VTTEEFNRRLIMRANAAGITIVQAIVERLEAYYRLLSTWNRRINLTALDVEGLPPEAIDRLFVEPLAAARYAKARQRLLDVGSGGGSPAIPFALATDAHALTMVESRSRKSVFLREAARVVGLERATVETIRFEDAIYRPDVRESFDCATIRAVRIEAADWLTLRYTVKPGGSVLNLHQGEVKPTEPDGFVLAEQHRLTATALLSIFTRLA
jgi:16S rRNA (guanine527-N7)-methyltransferase